MFKNIKLAIFDINAYFLTVHYTSMAADAEKLFASPAPFSNYR